MSLDKHTHAHTHTLHSNYDVAPTARGMPEMYDVAPTARGMPEMSYGGLPQRGLRLPQRGLRMPQRGLSNMHELKSVGYLLQRVQFKSVGWL